MKFYPATGINQRHFEEYLRFSEKHLMPFWLVFVDEGLKKIYGNTLSELEKPRQVEGRVYPLVITCNGGVKVRLWPLDAMEDIAALDDCAATALTSLSQRSYEYEFEDRP